MAHLATPIADDLLIDLLTHVAPMVVHTMLMLRHRTSLMVLVLLAADH